MANIPCTKPELCKVQTHRPGTVAACMTQRTRQNQTGAGDQLGARAPKLVAGGYLENITSRVPFGMEKVEPGELHGHKGLRISAGDRGGYLVTYQSDWDSNNDGDLIMMADEDVKWSQEYNDRDFEEFAGATIHKNSDGELWLTSHEIPGHKYGSPIKLDDLNPGDRNWVQEDREANGESGQDGEYATYELARRIRSNPELRRYAQAHATVRDPGIDDRYQREDDDPYYSYRVINGKFQPNIPAKG